MEGVDLHQIAGQIIYPSHTLDAEGTIFPYSSTSSLYSSSPEAESLMVKVRRVSVKSQETASLAMFYMRKGEVREGGDRDGRPLRFEPIDLPTPLHRHPLSHGSGADSTDACIVGE